MRHWSGIDDFLRYLHGVRRRTDAVVRTLRSDDMDWAPLAGTFSFGDMLRHLAGLERWMFAENVRGRESSYPGHGKEIEAGYSSTLAYFTAVRAESWDIFAGLGDADLAATCVTPGGAELRVGKWLRLMIEHEVHHRGQLYLMARLRGRKTPPLYGMTSEEVKDVSLSD